MSKECGLGRAPARRSLFDIPGSIFEISPLDPLHLQELQVHRRGATEDAHHDLQASLLRLHLVHHPREVGEWAVDDPHTLAAGELHPVLRPLGPGDHLLNDGLDLFLRNRRRAHPWKNLREVSRRFPFFSSTTVSVGIITWETAWPIPRATTRCSMLCLTLFSKPEYV